MWICTAVFFFHPLQVPGERAAPAEPQAALVSLLGESLAKGEAYRKLQELCRRAPKRLSGSAGATEAVSWAEAAMRADGLENVRLEPCTVPVWRRGKVARAALTEPATARESFLPILALGGSIGTPPEGVEGPLLVVESFEELTRAGERARGAIVLFNRPMDPRRGDPFEAYGEAVVQRSRGAVEAGKLGARAALVRSMTLRLDDVPHTGSMRYEDPVPRIPAAAISTAGAERLTALSAAGGRVRLRLQLDCETLPDAPSHNVVGEIVGRDLAEEIVLVGAHLDAWDVGEGAVDDGSGCAQAIEAARLLKALGLRPRRTLRIVLFMNEENGLAGGRAYRDAHAGELARHVLAVESDRGGFAPRGFGSNLETEALALLEPLRRTLADFGAGELRKGDGGADISPLEREGVPVAELLTDPQRYFDFHHSVRDTLDAVHPRELELGAGCLAALAWWVAELPRPLPRAR